MGSLATLILNNNVRKVQVLHLFIPSHQYHVSILLTALGLVERATWLSESYKTAFTLCGSGLTLVSLPLLCCRLLDGEKEGGRSERHNSLREMEGGRGDSRRNSLREIGGERSDTRRNSLMRDLTPNHDTLTDVSRNEVRLPLISNDLLTGL